MQEFARVTPVRALDVGGFIDAQPVGRFQVSILLACAAVLFVDGFDTQAIGYVAPAIARDWSLTRGALGPVFSAGLFGLMIGALVLGPVADRVGRRRIMLASTVVFGIFSLATAFAPDLNWLMALRFATGLGLGGAMPNAIALTAEYSPQRRRATMVMAMFCGFSVGAAAGGLIAAALIPAWGWQSVFIAGGAVPLALAPVLAARLPESVRFLALSGRDDAQVASLLRRLAPAASVPADTRFVIREDERGRMPVASLFREGRGIATALFWVVFFMSLLDLYLLSNWLPSVLNELGASVSVASVVGSMLQVGGVAGALTLGRFIDRQPFRTLAAVYALAAVAVVAVGQTGHSVPLAAVAIFCAGFCIVGGQTSANALAAHYYPTAIRSTGVGWALGIGRIGSIAGPLLGGVMLARHVGAGSLFAAAAVPAAIACAAGWGLQRLAGRRRSG